MEEVIEPPSKKHEKKYGAGVISGVSKQEVYGGGGAVQKEAV